ncbi:MAG: NPCBM/NEW2 domain-containing protein [Clostridiales bacterium]|nr:NPCBM/NEW2 domain-containing protein [Clostridiales bacterium]
MSYCKKCDTKINDEKFCPNCGSKISDEYDLNNETIGKPRKTGGCLKTAALIIIILAAVSCGIFGFMKYTENYSAAEVFSEIFAGRETEVSVTETETESETKTETSEIASNSDEEQFTQKTQSEENTKPYQIEDGSIEDILMGGVTYRDAVRLWSSDGKAFYNLNGEYLSISGVYGFKDDSSSNSKATLYFYGDNELLTEVVVEVGQLPKDFKLNLSGVYQLRIEAKSIEGYDNSNIGIGNIEFKK